MNYYPYSGGDNNGMPSSYGYYPPAMIPEKTHMQLQFDTQYIYNHRRDSQQLESKEDTASDNASFQRFVIFQDTQNYLQKVPHATKFADLQK